MLVSFKRAVKMQISGENLSNFETQKLYLEWHFPFGVQQWFLCFWNQGSMENEGRVQAIWKSNILYFKINNVINYRRTLFGDYRHYINIESDFVTCNSNVVFRRLSTIMFLYQDRHGNWVIGNYDSSSSWAISCIPYRTWCREGKGPTEEQS